MPGEAINIAPMPTAAEVIARLRLEPLPDEGGFFRQTYASAFATPTDSARPGCTAIYFLITPDGFSALHALRTDELWHFYAGDPVEHVMLNPTTGRGAKTRLGADLMNNEHPQLVVPGGVWQGARLAPRADTTSRDDACGWALLGCTMAPGWAPREFVLGQRNELVTRFPEWSRDVFALTR